MAATQSNIHRTDIIYAFEIIAANAHGIALQSGWWNDLETGKRVERNVGEMLCLIHSEISEAMEGHRKNLMDEHLPQYPSITVELADAIIRIADIGEGLGLDIARALADKMAFNEQREDHKIENRKKENGKKY